MKGKTVLNAWDRSTPTSWVELIITQITGTPTVKHAPVNFGAEELDLTGVYKRFYSHTLWGEEHMCFKLLSTKMAF